MLKKLFRRVRKDAYKNGADYGWRARRKLLESEYREKVQKEVQKDREVQVETGERSSS